MPKLFCNEIVRKISHRLALNQISEFPRIEVSLFNSSANAKEVSLLNCICGCAKWDQQIQEITVPRNSVENQSPFLPFSETPENAAQYRRIAQFRIETRP